MTYSIVARDVATGRLGVAVQSHALAVGRSVPWIQSGTGAIATQALTNPMFGPRGLEGLRRGDSPDRVVESLLATDERPRLRQLAIVDAHGSTAAATGSGCVPVAGHVLGEGYSVQGNMLASGTCLRAMAEAYEGGADVTFSERLLRVLEAAEATGGDVRGRQSAAIVIAEPHPDASPWNGITLDIRLVDDPDPLAELRRLVNLTESYALLDEDGEAASTGRPRLDRYAEARRRAPTAVGLAFRIAIELANAGDLAAARREMRVAVDADPRWRTALRRYDAAGRLTDPDTRGALLEEFGAATES
jgi:uncharacterized Ntn-hydrolase superfamily protein